MMLELDERAFLMNYTDAQDLAWRMIEAAKKIEATAKMAPMWFADRDVLSEKVLKKIRNESGVYFIVPEGVNAVKIGICSNLGERLGGLQCANPLKLHVAQFWKCDRDTALFYESVLHNRFRDLNIRGEWFLAKDIMLELGRMRARFFRESDNNAPFTVQVATSSFVTLLENMKWAGDIVEPDGRWPNRKTTFFHVPEIVTGPEEDEDDEE